jgi:hypothetical protein
MENEYGSYGDDHAYIQHLTDVARDILGASTTLYTTGIMLYVGLMH